MATSFSIKLNEDSLAKLKLLTTGIRNGAPRAMQRAINDTVNGARTDMVQQVADTYNLTKTRIRQDFEKGMKYATINDLTAKCSASGNAIRFVEGASGGGAGTFNFGAEAIRTGGVRARIKNGGGFEIWPNAFLAIMPNGHTGFFQRKTRAQFATSRTIYHGVQAQKLPWKRWYPLPEYPHRKVTELTGPAIESAFSTDQYPAAMPTVEKKVQDRMDANLNHQIDFEWSKF